MTPLWRCSPPRYRAAVEEDALEVAKVTQGMRHVRRMSRKLSVPGPSSLTFSPLLSMDRAAEASAAPRCLECHAFVRCGVVG